VVDGSVAAHGIYGPFKTHIRYKNYIFIPVATRQNKTKIIRSEKIIFHIAIGAFKQASAFAEFNRCTALRAFVFYD
jgi:hypothetical protein